MEFVIFTSLRRSDPPLWHMIIFTLNPHFMVSRHARAESSSYTQHKMTKISQSMIKEILGKGREITIKNGVNGVHAMLDALKSKEG